MSKLIRRNPKHLKKRYNKERDYKYFNYLQEPLLSTINNINLIINIPEIMRMILLKLDILSLARIVTTCTLFYKLSRDRLYSFKHNILLQVKDDHNNRNNDDIFSEINRKHPFNCYQQITLISKQIERYGLNRNIECVNCFNNGIGCDNCVIWKKTSLNIYSTQYKPCNKFNPFCLSCQIDGLKCQSHN